MAIPPSGHFPNSPWDTSYSELEDNDNDALLWIDGNVSEMWDGSR